MKMRLPLLFIIFAVLSSSSAEPTPIVIWHGMGDSCCDPQSMGWVIKLIQDEIPDVYIYSVALSEHALIDREKTFLANMNDEISKVCLKIAADPRLSAGYNAIGFSQGGQFLRAIAQRCPQPQMRRLITLGGQHQGVYGIPHCSDDNIICDTVRKLLDQGAYISFVQETVVQAQYFHDSDDEQTYREKSIFIADINNDKITARNTSYKKNLSSLEYLVLVLFEKDEMVVPKESSWFGFYKEKDLKVIVPYNESLLYSEDRIGLRTLDESGRLHFMTMPGNHLQIDKKIFVDDIILTYLV